MIVQLNRNVWATSIRAQVQFQFCPVEEEHKILRQLEAGMPASWRAILAAWREALLAHSA
jgi:hypothetical protein